MKILVTNTFKRSMKKLHSSQQLKLDEAIRQIQNNPYIGGPKLGDLLGVHVYKFFIFNQLILLAYLYNEQDNELTLLAFAPHENFYRDLKKQIKGREYIF
ncbi:type II toxin-antitoxin system RelE/ParE family toxin [Wolbachia endosymbiont of Pentalonia nigronervosa]|uniref:type II toxin-antitoxin system RelE/ParE family toxin n=1 Tax=Wolbachia endosymbiont of Pentalonia nigronervosa TaxID=1301914 RepID=UPI00165F1221|nr:type II toxin-antitoxin system RelE/ParE family toxin [Wolbachia endosymbiont of Pentalonia nigronervosa]